ncbi:MAG TPA: aldo/keto reductase, partial [Anaerolineae bacterium]|nr:aldo/keto reductase [Anaerolineae bacterium]
MIPGKATAEGTAKYAAGHEGLAYATLGDTGLSVSQAGFGGYRVVKDNGRHEQALRFALQNGINLIDTSSNYGDGRSEELIGRIVTELIDGGELRREQVVIVTKAGYLQGFNLALAQQRKQEGRPFPQIVHYAEGLSHCLHPEFLADQLTRSLERLNLETADGFLLHNPEYYLTWAKKAGKTREEARVEYYRRIRAAFVHLEEEAGHGRIQWYGVSSNTFVEPARHYTFTSLTRLWQMAQEINSDHHFRLAQMPLNLFETGAATEKNQPGGETTLQFARRHNLAVLINRPLNAIWQDALVRLATVDMPAYPAEPEEVLTAVDSLRRLERIFQSDILPRLDVDDESRQILREYLAIGEMLDGRWRGFGAYHNWRDIQTRFILRRAQTAVQFLSERENLPAEAFSWLDEYVEAANITLAAVSAYYQEISSRRAQRIQEAAVAADADWRADTLSQTAVRALRSTEGVTAVLVGMRQQAYAQDVLAELARPVMVKERAASWQKMSEG